MYHLQPYHGVSTLCIVLNNTEADKVKRAVETGLEQDLYSEWETLSKWIRGATDATTNWNLVSACRQKVGKVTDDVAERCAATFVRHSCTSGLTEENIGTNNDGALKANCLQNILPEVRGAVRLTTLN